MAHYLHLILLLLSIQFDPVQQSATIDPAMSGIRSKLWSGDPRQVAWGAHEAGSLQMTGARTDLIEVLPACACAGKPEWEWALAERAVLDALVRLGAKVPAEQMIPLLAGYSSNSALILFADAARGNEDVLIDTLPRWLKKGEGVGVRGLMIGSLLSELRVGSFARWLLPWKRIVLTVYIRGFGGRNDPSPSIQTTSGGSIAGPIPTGFPPYATYDLRTDIPNADEWSLVVDGPHPIYYRRSEHLEYRSEFTQVRNLDHEECAARWLAAMAGISVHEARVPAHDWVNIDWGEGVGELVGKITTSRDRLLDRYWKLVASLVKAGVLSSAEARGLAMEVLVRVEGLEERSGETLPELPPSRVVGYGEAREFRIVKIGPFELRISTDIVKRHGILIDTSFPSYEGRGVTVCVGSGEWEPALQAEEGMIGYGSEYTTIPDVSGGATDARRVEYHRVLDGVSTRFDALTIDWPTGGHATVFVMSADDEGAVEAAQILSSVVLYP